MRTIPEDFIREIGRKWRAWKCLKRIATKEQEKSLEYLYEISEGDAEHANDILENAMDKGAKRFYKIPRKEYGIVSKSPTVSKERILDSEGGTYEYYCITAASGMIEELTLEDICFVRDGLDKFIKEKKGGTR